MAATLALWVQMALVSFPVESVPSSHSVFSTSALGLPSPPLQLGCLGLELLATKSNLLLSDNVYNFLGCKNLKNVFVSAVTWCKLDVDGPENNAPSPTATAVLLTPGVNQRLPERCV